MKKTAQFKHLLSLHLGLTQLALSLKYLSYLLMESLFVNQDNNEVKQKHWKSRANFSDITFLRFACLVYLTHFPIQARSPLFLQKEPFPH